MASKQPTHNHPTVDAAQPYTLRPPSDASGYAVMFISMSLITLLFMIGFAYVTTEDGREPETNSVIYWAGIAVSLVMMLGFGMLLAFRRLRFECRPDQGCVELVVSGIFGKTRTRIPCDDMTAKLTRAAPRQANAKQEEDYTIILVWPGGLAEVCRNRYVESTRAEGEQIAEQAGVALVESLDLIWRGGRRMPVVLEYASPVDSEERKARSPFRATQPSADAKPLEEVFRRPERLAFGIFVAAGCMGLLVGTALACSGVAAWLTGLRLGDPPFPPAAHAFIMGPIMLMIALAEQQTFPGRRSIIRHFWKIALVLSLLAVVGMAVT